jgi:hypothetical protein
LHFKLKTIGRATALRFTNLRQRGHRREAVLWKRYAPGGLIPPDRAKWKAAVKGIGKKVFVPVTAEGQGGTAVEPIIERIVEVMGNREQAMRWLGTPVRALDFATPISMMATSSGKKRVLDVLGQMEHGVW